MEPFPVAGSVQTAPLFRVTSPVNVIARAVVVLELKFIVPDIMVVVVTVKFRVTARVDPLLITRLLQVVVADMVTTPAPVVAMTTASVDRGTTPPTQVVVTDQVPPAAVLVMVAALTTDVENRKTNAIKTAAPIVLMFIFMASPSFQRR